MKPRSSAFHLDLNHALSLSPRLPIVGKAVGPRSTLAPPLGGTGQGDSADLLPGRSVVTPFLSQWSPVFPSALLSGGLENPNSQDLECLAPTLPSLTHLRSSPETELTLGSQVVTPMGSQP